MPSSGDAQEARAKEFVRRIGYRVIVVGELNIKNLLHMKVIGGTESNCADILGFKPDLKSAGGVIICESKGTDVEHALVQLGNVAAAVLERFESEKRFLSDLILLVYRSSLRKLDIGDSPGPGYITGPPDHSKFRVLLDAGTTERNPAPATASIDSKRLDARLTKWAERVAKLPIYVYVES